MPVRYSILVSGFVFIVNFPDGLSGECVILDRVYGSPQTNSATHFLWRKCTGCGESVRGAPARVARLTGGRDGCQITKSCPVEVATPADVVKPEGSACHRYHATAGHDDTELVVTSGRQREDSPLQVIMTLVVLRGWKQK